MREFNKPIDIIVNDNKSLLSKRESKSFKDSSKKSVKEQINYFNSLKKERLIKYWLSFHQFKRLGLYDSLVNHKSNYPSNFVKGSKGYVLFNVNSDYSLRQLSKKDLREIENHLKESDIKARQWYINDIKKEQIRLLKKIETQLKRGNYVSLKMVNNGNYSNRELNRYVFAGVIKQFDKSVLSVLKIYSYLFNEQDLIKKLSEGNKISLVSNKELVNHTIFINELKRTVDITFKD